MKHLLAITIALLPSAALAEQFTPEQMLEVMTKSPSNRDVRVGDTSAKCPAGYYFNQQCGQCVPKAGSGRMSGNIEACYEMGAPK